MSEALPLPPARPSPELSPTAAAVLRAMREEVRAQSAYRTRTLAAHPAPASDLDLPPAPDALRAAARMEERLAALDVGGAVPEPHPAASGATAPAPVPALTPELLERIRSHLEAQSAAAGQARDALHARARLIHPPSARRVAAAATPAPGDSAPAAVERALSAAGGRILPGEREQLAALAAAAWEAGTRLDRLAERAAELLEMRRSLPGERAGDEIRTSPAEVLREVERRHDELARAALRQAALRDPSLLPRGEPRMQEGGRFQNVRSIDCLRCGTTTGREDGRSHLHPDGSPKPGPDKVPERPAPRDGEVCTPCYLASAPMSVPELKLAQRTARNLEATQLRFRPEREGWAERAGEWAARESARRGLTSRVEERLDAPSAFVVQRSPAELADRRMEEQLEQEWKREEARDRAQWDEPEGLDGGWRETGLSGDQLPEPPVRVEPSPERRVELETARLAEAQRRLRTVVGVEDPALRAALELQATVRLQLARGSSVREAWEATRGEERAHARAEARQQVEQRLTGPEVADFQRRLREVRGMALPRTMPAAEQAAVRARQVERILADLDVPTLVRRVDALRETAARPETVRAARELHDRLQPVLEDTRVQGAVASARLAETARQDRGVFHSGVDEAVLPGERRSELHERRIDGWLAGMEGAGIPNAREFARIAGELNPGRETLKHFPDDGERPWQILQRDAGIRREMETQGAPAPERIVEAMNAYREAVEADRVGDPYGEEIHDRITEAAARAAGFSGEEVDRLWAIRARAGAGGDVAAWDALLREAAAWSGDPGQPSGAARLRDALRDASPGDLAGARDRELLRRAEAAAAPYLDVLAELRAEWLARQRQPGSLPATEQERPRHPAVAAAMAAHTDPAIAHLAGQLAALEEFERIDAPYQAAMRDLDRAQTLVTATADTREAARLAWSGTEQTLRAQFSNADRLVEQVRGMDAGAVRALAASLRTNPLALTANHPRTGGAPRIPGINAAGELEKIEPHLKTVRAQGLRGLLGGTDRTATERQAHVAAVALETWADVRDRGDRLRRWAVSELGLEQDTPLAKVHETVVSRMAELRETHAELVQSWQTLYPPPTRAQAEQALRSMDPETAARAREALPALTPAPPPAAPTPPRPEHVLGPPALSR